MEIGEKTQVFVTEKSKRKHALVLIQLQTARKKGVHLESPLALSVQESGCPNSVHTATQKRTDHS